MKQHIALDCILSFLLENKDTGWVSSFQIQRELFPEEEHQTVEYYLQVIDNYPAMPPIVDSCQSDLGITLMANIFTAKFLNGGGFKALTK